MSCLATAAIIDCTAPDLDSQLEQLPDSPAVFAIFAREGLPYISRTSLLKRRLKRILRPGTSSRLLSLRAVAERVEIWPVASRLESSLILYDVTRSYRPDDYVDILKLRMPPYLRLSTGDFPRTHITTRLHNTGTHFGPFRTRALAELFDHDLLNLFQVRRCQEDLDPSPDHPGCIYGEMNMCLRPCQQLVGIEGYGSESSRVESFLQTRGTSLLRSAETARDRLSAELDFEGAARQHKRVESIQQLIRQADDITGVVETLHGVAITTAIGAGAINLWWLYAGAWQPPMTFSIALADQTGPMDRRLKTMAAAIAPADVSLRVKQEHLALLARWYFSTWRDGEWIRFEALDKVPYRRLVGAISRVAERTGNSS